MTKRPLKVWLAALLWRLPWCLVATVFRVGFVACIFAMWGRQRAYQTWRDLA